MPTRIFTLALVVCTVILIGTGCANKHDHRPMPLREYIYTHSNSTVPIWDKNDVPIGNLKTLTIHDTANTEWTLVTSKIFWTHKLIIKDGEGTFLGHVFAKDTTHTTGTILAVRTRGTSSIDAFGIPDTLTVTPETIENKVLHAINDARRQRAR